MTASVLILIIAVMMPAATLAAIILHGMAQSAPLGWQDATGFHFGQEPQS